MLLAELYGQPMSSASLYHFTPLRNFYQILKTDKLIPQARMGHDDYRKSISFTRDPRRTFIPNVSGEGIGLRFDRNKLASRYKLVPSTHNTTPRTSFVGSHQVTPDEAQRGKRFESEERVFDREIDNVKQYITGIVIPKLGKWTQVGMSSATDLAMSVLDLSGAFSDYGGRAFARDIRDFLLSKINELNVPLVFRGKDYPVAEVNKAIGKIYWMKKNKPEEFTALLSKFYNLEKGRSGQMKPKMFANVRFATGRGSRADFMGKGEL